MKKWGRLYFSNFISYLKNRNGPIFPQLIIGFGFCLIIICGIAIRPVASEEAGRDEILKSLLPKADSFKEVKGTYSVYEAHQAGKRIGLCFFTHDVVPDEKGYVGPIEMAACVDESGRIMAVRLLRHNETPQFVMGLSSETFLGQFIGKGPDDAFLSGQDIQAITGATISVTAVCRTLKKATQKVLGLPIEGLPQFQPGAMSEPARKDETEAMYYKVVE